MIDAGVPVIHGYHGNDQAYDTLFSEAEKIGFPVMIKAVMGGGGKVTQLMRRCHANARVFVHYLRALKLLSQQQKRPGIVKHKNSVVSVLTAIPISNQVLCWRLYINYYLQIIDFSDMGYIF